MPPQARTRERSCLEHERTGIPVVPGADGVEVLPPHGAHRSLDASGLLGGGPGDAPDEGATRRALRGQSDEPPGGLATLARSRGGRGDVAPADRRRRPIALDRIRSELREEVFPAVEQGVAAIRSISESSEERALVDHLQASWEAFRAFTDSPEFLVASSGRVAHDRFIESKVETLTRSFRSEIDRIEKQEESQALQARREAEHTYARSVALLRTIVVLGLFAGLGATVWLIAPWWSASANIRGSPRR
jgi:hypothetical protein